MTDQSRWLEQQGSASRALLEAHEAERAPAEVRRNSLRSARVALLGSGFLTAIETTTKPALASSSETSLTAATNAGTVGGAGLTSSLVIKFGVVGLLVVAGATLASSSFEEAQPGEAASIPTHLPSEPATEFAPAAEFAPASESAPAERSFEPTAERRSTVDPSSESVLEITDEAARAEHASVPAPQPARVAAKIRERRQLRPIGELPSRSPLASSSPESHLTAELELIQRARRLLKTGEPDAAIRVLDLYSTRHPDGRLAPEAQLLREQAAARKR